MVKRNTCIFISGKGSNLKNLINKSRNYNFPINVKLVICDNSSAYGIKHARQNLIPYLMINTRDRNFENIIVKELTKRKISLICLAGYMKIISKKFIQSFRGKIINIHPSLLPKFKGLNTFARILKENEVKTGCTVHFISEKLDSGRIIIQKKFYIDKKDNVSDLKIKTQRLEYYAYPEAIIKLFRNT